MPPAILSPKKFTARLVQVALADGKSFVTRAVERIDLDHEGVPGDLHRGFLRGADSRTPWYPRGVPIHNERHISAVSVEECAAVAARLKVARIDPLWLGANLVIEGVADFSFLPRGTRLMFPSGAALAVTDQNAPCRQTGRMVQSQYPDVPGLDSAFVRQATGSRGNVLVVERAGAVIAGESVEIRLPMQWLYQPT